jgi:hypothetical protein
MDADMDRRNALWGVLMAGLALVKGVVIPKENELTHIETIDLPSTMAAGFAALVPAGQAIEDKPLKVQRMTINISQPITVYRDPAGKKVYEATAPAGIMTFERITGGTKAFHSLREMADGGDSVDIYLLMDGNELDTFVKYTVQLQPGHTTLPGTDGEGDNLQMMNLVLRIDQLEPPSLPDGMPPEAKRAVLSSLDKMMRDVKQAELEKYA